MKGLIVAIVAFCLGGFVVAQQSTNFQLTEHSLSAGGLPAGGTVLASPNFQLSFAAVGEMVVGTTLSSPAFQMDGGFVASFPPPGEVLDLRFSDAITLEWNPEASVGTYHLYRDLLSNLSGLGYGSCLGPALTNETTTDMDPGPAGDGFFYLVTVRNGLNEEGTKGFDSASMERDNLLPCP